MKKIINIVGIYSIIHCIVDMASAMLIASLVGQIFNNNYTLLIGIILYNLFAFAFQLPFGIIADKLNRNALVSAVGCSFIILAYCLSSLGITACILAGIGNALFHIGGGIDVLNISNKKASLPGIYVATGALGLFIGSKSVDFCFNKLYIMVLILGASVLALIWLYKEIKLKYRINNLAPTFTKINSKKKLIIVCLLITICIRGYIGLILNFDWKANLNIAFIFIFSVVLGKMLGGIIGDKIGWRKISSLSLVLSAVFFVFSFNNYISGILAVLFFNMTMPITLTALSNIFNKNKGLAFGFSTLALFIGAIPVLLGYNSIFFDKIGLFIITIISAIILFFGLKEYEKIMEKNYDI